MPLVPHPIPSAIGAGGMQRSLAYLPAMAPADSPLLPPSSAAAVLLPAGALPPGSALVFTRVYMLCEGASGQGSVRKLLWAEQFPAEQSHVTSQAQATGRAAFAACSRRPTGNQQRPQGPAPTTATITHMHTHVHRITPTHAYPPTLGSNCPAWG